MRFRQVTRVSYQQFDVILNLISEDWIFHTSLKQLSVATQLAIALFRFGISGTGASVHNTARLFGTGDGSTIIRITRRIIKALLRLKCRFIYWPNEEERNEIVAETFQYLPRCIGWIYGTKIPLHEAPVTNKDSYYDKDKNYSIQVQIICDHDKKIRHYVAGYPGSVHDSKVWNECNIVQSPDLYFSDGQYLCGDKAYGLTKFIMAPFRDNNITIPPLKLKAFNEYYSKQRVKIESVNGALKETFGSLKQLRIQVCDKRSHQMAVNWISACLILYNIIMPEYPTDTDFVTLDNESESSVSMQEDEYSANDKRMALYHFVIDKLGIF